MIVIGITQIQSYVLIAEANGYVMGKSPTAPSPYAVWQIDDDGKGVCCGHYFVDREEAEWDFCARAFEWFEDNMYIHMIEDGEEHSETNAVSDTPRNPKMPFERELINGLRAIREDMSKAVEAVCDMMDIVDEMCAEMDRLKVERGVSK